MKIEAYVSFIDPNGVDVVNLITSYLAQATTVRTGGKPYKYPAKDDSPTIAPRQSMTMSLSGTEGDVDYIVLTYTTSKDGYNGTFYYFAEHIPNDARDAFGSKLYSLRIDSWATLRKLVGEPVTYATGTLIRGHRLADVSGSEYISQPVDVTKVTSTSQWGIGTTPRTEEMRFLIEADTGKGNLLFLVSKSSGDLAVLQKILSSLWLLDSVSITAGSPPFASTSINKILRVWLVPYDLGNVLATGMTAVYSADLTVNGSADQALFSTIMAGVVSGFTLSGWLLCGQYSAIQNLELTASQKLRVVGNSVKMVTVPAGGPSSGYFTISIVAPATADRGTVNPSSTEFSFTFTYRGEVTEFADTFLVSTGISDNQERRQAGISDALSLLSGGVSLAASAATGNVVGGVLGAANLAGGVAQMINRKYSRQMSEGGSPVKLLYFFDPAQFDTPDPLKYKIYGMALVTAESSNYNAVSAEALLFGPSGAERRAAHPLRVAVGLDPDVLYMQFAPGVRVKRDVTSAVPLYLYRDLERRLENGVRIWNEQEGYCDQ